MTGRAVRREDIRGHRIQFGRRHVGPDGNCKRVERRTHHATRGLQCFAIGSALGVTLGLFFGTVRWALWLFDPEWPDLMHPFASSVDTALPVPPVRTHLMLRYKPGWVVPVIGPNDLRFDLYPEESIEQWHKRLGLWVE